MSLLHTQEEYVCRSQEVVFSDDPGLRDNVTYFTDVVGNREKLTVQFTAATSRHSQSAVLMADENLVECLMKIAGKDRRAWIDAMASIISLKSWEIL